MTSLGYESVQVHRPCGTTYAMQLDNMQPDKMHAAQHASRLPPHLRTVSDTAPRHDPTTQQHKAFRRRKLDEQRHKQSDSRSPSARVDTHA